MNIACITILSTQLMLSLSVLSSRDIAPSASERGW